MAGRQDVRDEKRLVLEQESVLRDEKRLLLEEKRIQTESVAAVDRNNIERQRIALEERRMEADNKRAEEAAAERRLTMELQKSMIELIRDMNKR